MRQQQRSGLWLGRIKRVKRKRGGKGDKYKSRVKVEEIKNNMYIY